MGFSKPAYKHEFDISQASNTDQVNNKKWF